MILRIIVFEKRNFIQVERASQPGRYQQILLLHRCCWKMWSFVIVTKPSALLDLHWRYASIHIEFCEIQSIFYDIWLRFLSSPGWHAHVERFAQCWLPSQRSWFNPPWLRVTTILLICITLSSFVRFCSLLAQYIPFMHPCRAILRHFLQHLSFYITNCLTHSCYFAICLVGS